jgi:molecular chaperone HtpG
VKYGYISDDKFSDKANEFCLLKNTDNKFYTIDEYKDFIKENQTNKSNQLIALYTNHVDGHYPYISKAKDRGYDVLVLDAVIDNHFMQHLEQKKGDISFKRVDADTLEHLIEKEEKAESVMTEDEQKQIKELFEKSLNDKGAIIETKALSPNEDPVVVTKNEFLRRMQEMSRLSGQDSFGMGGDMYSLVVNTNHPTINQILNSKEPSDEKVRHLCDLALLSQGMLQGKALADFIKRSFER